MLGSESCLSLSLFRFFFLLPSVSDLARAFSFTVLTLFSSSSKSPLLVFWMPLTWQDIHSYSSAVLPCCSYCSTYLLSPSKGKMNLSSNFGKANYSETSLMLSLRDLCLACRSKCHACLHVAYYDLSHGILKHFIWGFDWLISSSECTTICPLQTRREQRAFTLTSAFQK